MEAYEKNIIKELSALSPQPLFSEQSIRFFAYKRELNFTKYQSLNYIDATYYLQKKYQEFCLLLYWIDNGLSKQQHKFIEENRIYNIYDLMKAFWAVKYNIVGPIWPIHGYTKELFLEIKNEEAATKLLIEREIRDKNNWELLWSADIQLESGNKVVSYIMRFIELLTFMRPVLYYDTKWEDFVANTIWTNDIDWRFKLSLPAKMGPRGAIIQDSAYKFILRYTQNTYPNIYAPLEKRYEDFNLIFGDEHPQARAIQQLAIREGRPLTKIEKDWIDELNNPTSLTQSQIENIFLSAQRPKQVIPNTRKRHIVRIRLRELFRKYNIIVDDIDRDAIDSDMWAKDVTDKDIIRQWEDIVVDYPKMRLYTNGK